MTNEEAKEVISYVRSIVAFKRKAKGLSLRELFKQCGVSIATLSRFDGGRSLDAETFLKIVEWLHEPHRVKSRK